MRVTNIRKTTHPIPDDTMTLIKKLNCSSFVPTVVPRSLSFDLEDTTTEFANAIRRCANSEIPILALHFDHDTDITTDDPYIIVDELSMKIGQVPISQISGINFSLNVTNDLDVVMPVYSNNMIEDGKKQHNESLFAGSIILTYLSPGKKLHIKNIKPVVGTGYMDSMAYNTFPGKVEFECLDLKRMEDEHKDKYVNVAPISSLESEPTMYRLGISYQKYIEPSRIIKQAANVLIGKTISIAETIEITDGNIYTSDTEITYTKEFGTFKIYNETYTIGHLLARYCMFVDSSIPNVSCVKPHTSDNFIVIKIYHSNSRSVMLSAIELVQKDLKTVSDSF